MPIQTVYIRHPTEDEQFMDGWRNGSTITRLRDEAETYHAAQVQIKIINTKMVWASVLVSRDIHLDSVCDSRGGRHRIQTPRRLPQVKLCRRSGSLKQES
jgi:hypothetical protein